MPDQAMASVESVYQATRKPASRRWLALAAIVVLGAGLRFYGIDRQSAWGPEIMSVYVSALTPREILVWNIEDYKHYLDSPLYYFVLHGWFAVTGVGVLQARILAATFGVLCIPAVYLFASLLVERRVALLAALILAVSQPGLLYSQEARPYTQVAFFVLAASYLFLRALRERSPKLWWAFVASAVAMFFSHYYGLLVILALAAFAFALRRRYPVPRRWWLGAALSLAAPAAAWFLTVAVRLPITTDLLFRADRSLLGIHVSWRHLVAALNWFNNGKLFGPDSPSPRWLVLLGFALFTLPAAVGASWLYRGRLAGVDPRRQREASVLLNALWIFPVTAIVGLGMLGYNKYLDFENHIRFAMLAVAPYYVLVACGIAAFPSGWLRRTAIVVVSAFCAISFRGVYLADHKADYRAGVTYIADHYREGDCAVFYPPGQYLLLGHRVALPQYWYVYNRNKPEARVGKMEEILSGTSSCRRVWFFWDQTPWLNPDVAESAQAMRDLDRTHVAEQVHRYYQAELGLYIPRR